MSDTPRTDSEKLHTHTPSAFGDWVRTDFARELERENATLQDVAMVRETQFRSRQEEIDRLRAAMVTAREAIRQLAALANVNKATREMLIEVGNHLNDTLL